MGNEENNKKPYYERQNFYTLELQYSEKGRQNVLAGLCGVGVLGVACLVALLNGKGTKEVKQDNKDSIPTTGVEQTTKDNLIPSESTLAQLITTLPETTKADELYTKITEDELAKMKADFDEKFALTGLNDIYKPSLDYTNEELILSSFACPKEEIDKLNKFIVDFCQKYNIRNLDLTADLANKLPKDFAEMITNLSIHSTHTLLDYAEFEDVYIQDYARVDLQNFSNLSELTSFGVHLINLTSCRNLKSFSLLNYEGYGLYYDFEKELEQLEELSYIVGEYDFIRLNDIFISKKLPVSKKISITIKQNFGQNIKLTETDYLALSFETSIAPQVTITGKVNETISCLGDGSLNLESLEGEPKLYDEKGEVSYKKEQAYILVRKND